MWYKVSIVVENYAIYVPGTNTQAGIALEVCRLIKRMHNVIFVRKFKISLHNYQVIVKNSSRTQGRKNICIRWWLDDNKLTRNT